MVDRLNLEKLCDLVNLYLIVIDYEMLHLYSIVLYCVGYWSMHLV